MDFNSELVFAWEVAVWAPFSPPVVVIKVKTSRPSLLRGVCAQKWRKHWSCIDHPCPIRKGDINLVGIHPIRAIMGDRRVLCVPRGRRYLCTPYLVKGTETGTQKGL